MKIIGLLTAWACEDWIKFSIEQALNLVDELIISIGAFDKYFKIIEDNTFKIARRYSNNPKVKFIETICNLKETRKNNRCATLNRMLKASVNIKTGNLIWILDADEFYSKDSIQEIKNYIYNNNEFDAIRIKDRFFCINMNYYVDASHERILK
ncbi:MAG: hypothetical protein ACTSQJ_13920, partial [Promethearchaeota archaeon]